MTTAEPSHGFDEIINAIQEGVERAAHNLSASSLMHLQSGEFWEPVLDEDGAPKTENGNPVLKPKMVTLEIPTFRGGKDTIVTQKVNVPLQTLCNGHSLGIKEVKIETEVDLHADDGDEEPTSPETEGQDEPQRRRGRPGPAGRLMRLRVRTAFSKAVEDKGTRAKISITFTEREPPEGFARINNKLVQLLP